MKCHLSLQQTRTLGGFTMSKKALAENEPRMPKKFEQMAMDYVELSRIKKPNAEQAKSFNELRRELSARGLNPQHIDGLIYRATVYDNKTAVATYVKMHDDDSRRAQYRARLHRAGIDWHDKQKLSHILADIAHCAKVIDKKKTTKGVCLSREDCDQRTAEIAAELHQEEIASAAEEIAAEEAARVKRERLTRESINEFVQNAFAGAANA